jgi:hypothetical protein
MPTNPYSTEAKFLNNPRTVRVGGPWELQLDALRFDIGAGIILEAPQYSLSDGPSIPLLAQFLVPRDETMRMGFLHDALRSTLKTSNFATDGLMLDAALACGLSYPRALAAWLGVRIGTATGFKSEPPAEVIAVAKSEVFLATQADPLSIYFDREESRFKIKES